MATTLKINYVSIGVEKTVCQTGKGSDPLFEYNCLCLPVNLIVGHLKLCCISGREVNQSLIKPSSEFFLSSEPIFYNFVVLQFGVRG
jgi:hypothetical protein